MVSSENDAGNGEMVTGDPAHLHRADADPGGVAGAHLVRHDEDQVGVRDLGHGEGPAQGTQG